METGDFVCFEEGRRPVIELRLGDRWLPGEVRAWIRRGTGWWAHIDYDLDHQTYTATVPATRIRSPKTRGQPPVGAHTDDGPGPLGVPNQQNTTSVSS